VLAGVRWRGDADEQTESRERMNLLAPTDETFMQLALQQALKAEAAGEVPVGAVLVHDGQVLARAHNQVETLRDATAHAEILAITQASAALGDWRLEGAVLYVTKEPCAMCAGALVNSRVTRAVYGVSDPRAGAAGSALEITAFPGMLHQVQVTGGVLEAECREILQVFFQRRRRETKDNG
jgi:tRNA(adenine34) deaminase